MQKDLFTPSIPKGQFPWLHISARENRRSVSVRWRSPWLPSVDRIRFRISIPPWYHNETFCQSLKLRTSLHWLHYKNFIDSLPKQWVTSRLYLEKRNDDEREINMKRRKFALVGTFFIYFAIVGAIWGTLFSLNGYLLIFRIAFFH